VLAVDADDSLVDTLDLSEQAKNDPNPRSRAKSGRIAVKVINHLGDEVMKVFGVK
jgi:adenine-specific DNA-methyltransferase